jgi:hypothetical protein
MRPHNQGLRPHSGTHKDAARNSGGAFSLSQVPMDISQQPYQGDAFGFGASAGAVL